MYLIHAYTCICTVYSMFYILNLTFFGYITIGETYRCKHMITEQGSSITPWPKNCIQIKKLRQKQRFCPEASEHWLPRPSMGGQGSMLPITCPAV